MSSDDAVKGLECCLKGECKECPYKKYTIYGCEKLLLKDALNHLASKKSEIVYLKKKYIGE